jgi:hypothetical protein
MKYATRTLCQMTLREGMKNVSRIYRNSLGSLLHSEIKCNGPTKPAAVGYDLASEIYLRKPKG